MFILPPPHSSESVFPGSGGPEPALLSHMLLPVALLTLSPVFLSDHGVLCAYSAMPRVQQALQYQSPAFQEPRKYSLCTLRNVFSFL